MEIKRGKRVKNNMLPDIGIGNIDLTDFKVFNHYFVAHAKWLRNETGSSYRV